MHHTAYSTDIFRREGKYLRYTAEIKQTFKQGNVLKEDHINPMSLIFDFIFVSLLPSPTLIYFIVHTTT